MVQWICSYIKSQYVLITVSSCYFTFVHMYSKGDNRLHLSGKFLGSKLACYLSRTNNSWTSVCSVENEEGWGRNSLQMRNSVVKLDKRKQVWPEMLEQATDTCNNLLQSWVRSWRTQRSWTLSIKVVSCCSCRSKALVWASITLDQYHLGPY